MAAQALVLYKQPSNPAEFDRYYFEVHAPLANKIPHLESFVVGRSPLGLTGDSPYYLVAELNYASADAMQAAFASPEGKAAAADLANFADGGVDILTFDTIEP